MRGSSSLHPSKPSKRLVVIQHGAHPKLPSSAGLSSSALALPKGRRDPQRPSLHVNHPQQ